MSKHKLVLLDGATDLYKTWLTPIVDKYFQIEFYDQLKQYDKSYVFLTSGKILDDNFKQRYLDNGYKLIVDNLWEAATFMLVNSLNEYKQNILVLIGALNKEYKNRFQGTLLEVPNWFWYNESLMLQYTGLGKGYVPNRSNSKLFLMPIRKSKPYRDQIIKKFENLLDNSIYSYQFGWRQQNLPRYTHSVMDETAPDRVFEKEWYDQTYFSVVVETNVGTEGHLVNGTIPTMFITEKTYKPIAFQHPFLIIGLPNTLLTLKNNGFETYDHLFDEQYDSILDFNARLDNIYNNITSFDIGKYTNPLTKEKILHNYNLFYDSNLIEQKIVSEVIEPILKFVDEQPLR